MRRVVIALVGMSLYGISAAAKSPEIDKKPPLPSHGEVKGRLVSQPRQAASRADIVARTGAQVRSQKEATNQSTETYRGYFFDLAAITDRQDFRALLSALHRQIDIIEDVKLSSRVLGFFRTVPVVVDEFACMGSMKSASSETVKKPVLAAGCYAPYAPARLQSTPNAVSVWDHKNWRWSTTDPIAQAEDGVVMVRTRTLDPKRPILLHEMLHAYHAKIVPQGFGNAAIKFYYDTAKTEQLYPTDAYLLVNEREFFAVTASVFLYGADGPITRSILKEKQPDYYTFLKWLLAVDPDGSPRMSPVASTD